jgi:hypothetical protein
LGAVIRRRLRAISEALGALHRCTLASALRWRVAEKIERGVAN